MKHWLLVFLFATLHIQGQNISSWFTMDNGLPQNSIKDIVKDKYGFIWLSTDNGIVRYDGAYFLTFDKLAVRDFHFGAFYGNIGNDSIVAFNNYEESTILINKRSSLVIKKRNKENTGVVFYQSDNKQMARTTSTELDTATNYLIRTKFGVYNINHHNIVYTDKATQEKKTFSLAKAKKYNFFLYNDILCITDPSNTETHYIFRGKDFISKKTSVLNDPQTKIYWQQLTGQVFLVNNDHIYIITGSENNLELKFRLLTRYDKFGNYRFGCIYYDDKFQRLYLGSSVKGLNILQLTQFHTARKNIPFIDDVSSSSLPFSSNTIIDAHGYEYNRDGMLKAHRFGSNDKYFMFYDPKGNLLYKHKNFIFRRYRSSEYKVADSISFSGTALNGIFSSGNLFGISKTDYANSFLHVFNNSALKRPNDIFKFKGVVNSFLKYGTDRLLVGSSDGLYCVFLREKKIILIKNLNVKSIFTTKDGNTWITTNKEGFFLFKNSHLIKMPLDQQQYLASAHFIVDDPFGFYWISSNNGLFKVQKKQLIQASTKKNSKVFYYRFTKNDGLLTNEFNGGSMPNAYSLQNNEVIFPSMEGFVFFDPKKVRSYYPGSDKIFIERAGINNHMVYFKNYLLLENDYTLADIFIDLPYFADSSNLSIEAKIENQDQNWQKIDLKDQRKFTIKTFDPGEYTLKIRILTTPDGNYKYHIITFKIKPLFYQTKVFKAGMLVILLIIIVLIVRILTQFIRRRNKVLKTKVSNISMELQETSQHLENVKNHMLKESEYQKKFVDAINHDITTPVKFIAMLAQKLNEEEDLKIQKEYFEGIYQTSEELYKFTLNLKEYNNLYTAEIYTPEEFPIHEIFESKQKLFNEIAKLKNNHIEIQNKNTITCTVNKSIIACIVHNLIDNAVKYSSESIISLNAKEAADKIIIKIEDEGIGMSHEQLSYYNDLSRNNDDAAIQFKRYGLGLHMVINLIKKINAEIEFRKNTPSGTIIEINIYNQNR